MPASSRIPVTRRHELLARCHEHGVAQRVLAHRVGLRFRCLRGLLAGFSGVVLFGAGCSRGGGEPGGQGRRDDVPGLQVAVRRGGAGTPGHEHGDVGADDGVDLVLRDTQLALAGGGLDLPAQGVPAGTVVIRLIAGLFAGQVEWRVGVRQPLQEAHQGEQLGAEEVEVAAGLVLVLQGPAQPEERDRRWMGVDLDGAPGTPRARVHVQAEGLGQGGPARGAVELRLAGVGRVRAGVEAGEVLVERGLGGPVAGRVAHDERGVDGDQAVTLGVRRQRRQDLLVGADRRQVDQPARVVEHGDAGGALGPPGEVDSDVEHTASLPHAGRRCGRWLSQPRVSHRPGVQLGLEITRRPRCSSVVPVAVSSCQLPGTSRGPPGVARVPRWRHSTGRRRRATPRAAGRRG